MYSFFYILLGIIFSLGVLTACILFAYLFLQLMAHLCRFWPDEDSKDEENNKIKNN